MTRVKLALLAVLFGLPMTFLVGVGSYHLYSTGWAFIAWWPMAACWVLAYFLTWYWTRKRTSLLPKTDFDILPKTFTPRDAAAWDIVKSTVNTSTPPTAAQLGDARYYTDEALALATRIARHYHPESIDPFGHLTLPEILTCEVVARDLGTKVNAYVPGSHLLTVSQWQAAKKTLDWGQHAWNLSWLGRMVLDPLKAGTQFLAAKAGGSVLTHVQNNALAWFHEAYVHELGRHLIELNSGRLRVGADRHEELAKGTSSGSITIALLGAVNAGKSSLINALLGESKAAVDNVPRTDAVTQYELKRDGEPQLKLLDTPGYGGEAAFASPHFNAAVEADIVLLVVHARSAARAADVEFEALDAAFALQPGLRKPEMIVVATHIDMLTPAAEWSPPYDYETGTRVKEESVRAVLAAIAEDLGTLPMVPVCVKAGRVDNVAQGLVPLMAAVLDSARGVAVLRAFHAEAHAKRFRRTIDQAVNLGRESLKVLWNATAPR